MPNKSDIASTAEDSSKNYTTPLEECITSPPTIVETLAFLSATKDPQCKVSSKTNEMKKSLHEWQVKWDKLKQPKK